MPILARVVRENRSELNTNVFAVALDGHGLAPGVHGDEIRLEVGPAEGMVGETSGHAPMIRTSTASRVRHLARMLPPLDG